jgi:hypothetical protein
MYFREGNRLVIPQTRAIHLGSGMRRQYVFEKEVSFDFNLMMSATPAEARQCALAMLFFVLGARPMNNFFAYAKIRA